MDAPASAAPPPPSAAPSSSSSSSSQNESFVLLANGARGAAAVQLVRQALEAPAVFVFGELLDHPNIRALSSAPPADGPAHLRLLELFAHGTYDQYLRVRDASSLPDLTGPMARKLRLLTLASMATSARVLRYGDLRRELRVDSVRELEDLIIEGAGAGVAAGKLDQQSLHFEVDYVMPRDIRREEVKDVVSTLESWCKSCDGMLRCLEDQASRANSAKSAVQEHRKEIDQKVRDVRGQLKQSSDGGADDPDSRMDTDRYPSMDASSSRRETKKGASKAKGQRGAAGGGGGERAKGGGGGGGGGGFWQK